MTKKDILNLIAKDSLEYKDPNSLFLFISSSFDVPVAEVKSEFKKLLKNGEIFEIKKGKYIPIPSKNYYKGKLGSIVFRKFHYLIFD